MKEKRIKVIKKEDRKVNCCIDKVNLASEWFECTQCGYKVRYLVKGNTAKCSQCGGTMRRI